MINRWAYEAFDKTLSDIMNDVTDGDTRLPFGGKCNAHFRLF